MASLVAPGASSVVGFSAPWKAQFAGGELGSSSRRAAAPISLSRTTRGGRRSGRRSGAVRAASSGMADENMIPDSAPGAGGYNSVDADMMALRRRIEGIRMKETFIQAPEEWMEWEKSWHRSYRADVNILVARLQSQLLGMRPSVVLFIVTFVLAVTPAVALLALSALGSQLYSMNNAVLDFLAPCSAVTPTL